MLQQINSAKSGAGWAIAIGAVVIGIWWLGRQAKGAVVDGVKSTATAVSNINQGTPYEGAGVVGTLGHATDTISGGLFSSAGEWLGGKLYDLFGDDPAVNPSGTTAPIIPAQLRETK